MKKSRHNIFGQPRYVAVASLCLLFFWRCSEDKNIEKLLGHWHTCSPETSMYSTLDILDSIAITDRYGLDIFFYEEYRIRNAKGQITLPVGLYETSTSFGFNGDTLVIKADSTVVKYLRSDLDKCLISDRYEDCVIDVSLPDLAEPIDFEVSWRSLHSEEVFVGRLKPGSPYIDSLREAFPDSIFIQARNVLILSSNIPVVCERFQYMYPNPGRQLNVNLHLGKDVPQSHVDEIIGLIPANFNVHQAVKGRNGDIGLKRLR
jgi:hypothetical protein